VAHWAGRGDGQAFVTHPQEAEHHRDPERRWQAPQRRRHAPCSQAIVVRDAVEGASQGP